MTIAKENIFYFCEKQNMSVEDLFSKLGIDKELYFSDKYSKKIKKLREDANKVLAKYFKISTYEFENRCFSEPEVLWILDTKPEVFFKNLIAKANEKTDYWKRLNEEDALRYKSNYGRKLAYQYIAFEHKEQEYSIVMHTQTINKLFVDENNAIVSLQDQPQYPTLVICVPNYCSRELSIDDKDPMNIKIKEMFDKLLYSKGLENSSSWDYNSHFKYYLSYPLSLNSYFEKSSVMSQRTIELGNPQMDIILKLLTDRVKNPDKYSSSSYEEIEAEAESLIDAQNAEEEKREREKKEKAYKEIKSRLTIVPIESLSENDHISQYDLNRLLEYLC